MTVRARWKAKLKIRERLLARARKTGRNVPRREQQVAEARRVLERHAELNRTVGFDGVPVFRGLALMLQDARDRGWTGTLNSADRRDGVAERYGKRSQAALYAGWVRRQAGFNPANPPGRSTHELRSDGVAYRGPVGRPLSWWQLGLDVSEAEELRAVLNRLGYSAFRPYADGREAHHVNLKRNPRRRLRARKVIYT